MSELGEALGDFGRNINQEANRFGARIGKDLDRNAANLGFQNFEDMALDTATGGMVGLNAEGEIEKGRHLKAIDEGIGEVSGRNARRAELHRQERLLAEETVTRERLEAEERLADEKADRAASLAAPGGGGQAATRRSAARSSSDRGSGFKLGEQRDFLGL